MSISENSNLSKSELIKKLEAISILHNKALAIKIKMNNFKPEDNYERKVNVPLFPGEYENDDERENLENAVEHEDKDAIEQMGQKYDFCYAPKKPAELVIKDFEFPGEAASKEKQNKYGCFSYVAAAVSGFFLLSLLLGTADGAVAAIVIIAVIAALVFAFFRYKIKTEKDASDKQKAEALAQYNLKKNQLWSEHHEKIKVYEDKCNIHNEARKKFVDEYAKWRKIYIEHINEEARIAEQLENDRVVAVEKIHNEEFKPILEDLDTINDILTLEYLPAIDTIIDLLKSSRADDLKEAINLYEDIVYRERQLQQQKEQEEQRRYEEELRRQDAERHYQEEKQFREQQERARKQEAQERARAEEQRHREDLAQREKLERDRRDEENRLRKEQQRREERAELDRKHKENLETSRQCNTCALCGNCSMAFRRPNCASYKPR